MNCLLFVTKEVTKHLKELTVNIKCVKIVIHQLVA